VELAELVHPAGVLARDELPLVLFLVPVDPAPGVEAPHVLLLRPVTQLAERHPELGAPSLLVVGHLAVPHGVPGRVPLLLAVAEDQVDLAAAGREVELEAGALVVVAVEADADDVAGEIVAPAGVAVDLRRVVVGADREVDVPVVVEDLELGPLGGGSTLRRRLLGVVARPFALLPRFVVEATVDHGGLHREALGHVDADRVLAPEGVWRRRLVTAECGAPQTGEQERDDERLRGAERGAREGQNKKG
jgi:hypothetical protein